MKKVLGVVTIALAVLVLSYPNLAHARPEYKRQFEQVYKDSKIIEAAKKAKCFTCHYGKSKKNRNDYGKALSKLLNGKEYKILKKEKRLAEKVTKALKAVEKQKSVSGTLFGKLIQEGKLPGTAPEEKEEKKE